MKYEDNMMLEPVKEKRVEQVRAIKGCIPIDDYHVIMHGLTYDSTEGEKAGQR